MTWQDALLALLCFAILGWLIADSFILRSRNRRLQRIVEGFAARIVSQSHQLSMNAERNNISRDDLQVITDIPGVSVEFAGETLLVMRTEETANLIRRFGTNIEDNTR